MEEGYGGSSLKGIVKNYNKWAGEVNGVEKKTLEFKGYCEHPTRIGATYLIDLDYNGTDNVLNTYIGFIKGELIKQYSEKL